MANDLIEKCIEIASEKYSANSSFPIDIFAMDKAIQSAIDTIRAEISEPNEAAKKALSLWDRYQPNISTDEVIRQANDVAEALRSLLSASPLGEKEG